jgi:hypothetical protein
MTETHKRWTITLPDGSGFDLTTENTYEADVGMQWLLTRAGCNAYGETFTPELEADSPKPKALAYLDNAAGAEAWRKAPVPNTPPGYQQPGHIFPPLS